MKKTVSLLLICIVLMSLLCSCGTPPEEYIAMGDAAMASGDLSEALEYYKQAGTEGDEKELEVLRTRIKLYFRSKPTFSSVSNYQLNNYKDVQEYLDENAKYTFTEEERNEFLLSCIDETVEDMLEGDRNLHDVADLLYVAGSKIPAQTPGYQEMLNKNYYKLGYEALKRELENNTKYSWAIHDAIWYWQNCTEGPGYECLQAMEEMIPQKKYVEAFDILETYLEKDIMYGVCTGLREETSFESIGELFAFESFYYALFPRGESAMSLTESFQSLRDAFLGNNHVEESVILSVSELESACGLAPEGRILFLHKPKEYEDTLGLYLPMMDLLPSAYYPHNLESAEYVVLMDCDTIETGATFGEYTKELREDTTVKVYDVKTGEVIFESLHKGPTHYMMSYYGDKPPSVYSAGAPDVSNTVKEAVSAIEKYMNP